MSFPIPKQAQSLLLALVFLSSIPAAADILSCKDWKNQELEKSKQELEEAKKQLPSRSPGLKATADTERLRRVKIEQAQTKYENAQGLTSRECFIIQFSENYDSKEDFTAIVKKLNVDELAEILLDYKKELKKNDVEAGLPELHNSIGTLGAMPPSR